MTKYFVGLSTLPGRKGYLMSNWVFANVTNSKNRYAFKKLNDFAMLALHYVCDDEHVTYTIFPIVNGKFFLDSDATLVCRRFDFIDLTEAVELVDARINNSYISDDFISWNHGKYDIVISHGKSTIFTVVRDNVLVKKIDFHEMIVLGDGVFPHKEIGGSVYGMDEEYISVCTDSYPVTKYIPETV